MKAETYPTPQDIEAAHKRIMAYVHRTPVFTSQHLDIVAGNHLYFKCENFQRAGSFKMRGATNAMLTIAEEERRRGVATHSSGNHAQALALAARLLKIEAHVVMPENASRVKVEAVKGYGAMIYFCAPNQLAREEALRLVVEKTGAHFIPPYDDYRIIAGQSTAAKELIEEISDLDYLLAPVGGGGLLGGTALSAHYFSGKTKVIGCEPEGADDAYRSFYSGKISPSQAPKTIADGLLTTLGSRNFPIIRDHVCDIWLACDKEIVDAMLLIWERMKIIIEPSSAVPLAALLRNKHKIKNKRIGIILSGGNYDLRSMIDFHIS